MTELLKIIREDGGQDLAEYALLIALLALVVIGTVVLFGGTLTAFFDSAGAMLFG